jgi:uncharacterized protein YigE (DUF2233 family)
VKRSLALAASLTLALCACSQEPAGESVVKIALDGSEIEETPAPTPSAAAGPSACEAVTFEDVVLTHCVADPAQHRIGMANLGTDKQPFGSLGAFAGSVDPGTIAFAINGGMYGDDLKAIGYYVQNGVFFGTGGSWRVLGSNTFFETVGDRPEFGTQSGPLLLIDGNLHPEIQDDGPSKAIRNAVGVDASGKAHFVISGAPVSFGQLARYYRDVLKVSNALYLDGAMSSLWDPATERLDKGRVGPIIVVTKREKAAAE